MKAMQVEFKEPENRVRLGDLPVGVVFRHHADVCMKTADKKANGVVCCVNMAGFIGQMRDLVQVTEVEPLDATLTIFEREA